MKDLGPAGLPVLDRLAAHPADRLGRVQPGRPRLLLAARRRAARRAASSPSSRSTTGTCRRRSRTRAAGPTATPRCAFADYAAHVAEALGDRVHAVDHAQRAVVLGVPRLRRPACTPPARTDDADALAAVAPPQPRARPRRPRDPRRARRGHAALGHAQPARHPRRDPTPRRTSRPSAASTPSPTRSSCGPMLDGALPRGPARRHRARHRLVVRAGRRPRDHPACRSTCSASTTTRPHRVRHGTADRGDGSTADGHGASRAQPVGRRRRRRVPRRSPARTPRWAGTSSPQGLTELLARAPRRATRACR